MKKEQIKIKETLSMNDRVLMPQELMEGHFSTDTDGNIIYTPYYADMMLISAFFLHCVDGLTFETNEDPNTHEIIPENIYETVTQDEELMQLYDEFFDWDKDTILSCPYKNTLLQMYGILSDVEKMVEYRKQELLHKREDVVAAFLNAVAGKIMES